MNARIALVLVVLLAVLGGGALLVRQQGESQKPAASAVLGQPLLKGLKASDVAAIRIQEPGREINLVRKDKGWVVAERGDFPADLERVSELVLKAIEIKIGQSEPIGEKDRARLALVEPAAGKGAGTLLELKAADGKALARLLVGKKHFKSGEPANADRAPGDGRYVLLPADDKTVYTVSDPLSQVSAQSAAWVAKPGIAAEKVRSLEYKAADGAQWRIERSGDNAEWKLVGAKPDEKLEITKANAASYALSNLDIADVAAGDLKPEATGLDKPATLSAQTFDGLAYTLSVGKPEGDNYYVRVAVSGTPAPEGKDAEERAKKLAERLPREKTLEPYTLLVPKSRLEDALKARSELLAKKEETKK